MNEMDEEFLLNYENTCETIRKLPPMRCTKCSARITVETVVLSLGEDEDRASIEPLCRQCSRPETKIEGKPLAEFKLELLLGMNIYSLYGAMCRLKIDATEEQIEDLCRTIPLAQEPLWTLLDPAQCRHT